jgi:drug/metabolite transporter (DMT)-like permease
MFPVIAVGGALGASATDGITAVLDERTTKQVATHRSAVSVGLIFALLHRPVWLLAISLNIVGVVFQIVALHFGALALVQPIMVCDLIFAVFLSAAFRHARPDRVMLIGVACCAGGLGWFLAVARPHGGNSTVSAATAIPLLIAVAALLAGCLVAARFGHRMVRPLMLGLACGVCYGVTAFLFKLLTGGGAGPAGFFGLLQRWPLWAVIVIGPLGFLLNQSAYQAGVLVSPVLSVITAADPIVSIALAHQVLHESLAGGALNITLEVVAFAVMVVGIVTLAHRAPLVAPKQGAAMPRPAPAKR